MELTNPFSGIVDTLENFRLIIYSFIATVVLIFPPILTAVIAFSRYIKFKGLYAFFLGAFFIFLDYISMIVLMGISPDKAIELKSFDIAFLMSAIVLGYIAKIFPNFLFYVSIFLVEYIYFSEYTYPNYINICEIKCLQVPTI
jgi:hypothetical protein